MVESKPLVDTTLVVSILFNILLSAGILAMSCRRKSIEALVKGYCLYATQGGIQGEIRATCPVLSRFVSQNGTSMRRLVNGKRCSSHDVPRWLSTEVVQETGRQGTEKRTNSWMYKSLLLLPPAIAAYLGTWQLERREGKIKLLEQRRAMVKVCMYGSFFFFIPGIYIYCAVFCIFQSLHCITLLSLNKNAIYIHFSI